MKVFKDPVSVLACVSITMIVLALAFHIYRERKEENRIRAFIQASTTDVGTLPAEPGREGVMVKLLPFNTQAEPAKMEWENLGRDDLSRLALRNLNGTPNFSSLYPVSDQALDEGQKWIDGHRAWAEKLTDRRLRNAYTDWMDYFQGRLDENREENRTHARQKERERYGAAKQKEEDRLEGIDIPRPPR